MKLVSGIVDSGFFAQSALSAEVATKDSLGRNISETYLTGVDLTPYQTTADMVNYQPVSSMTAYQEAGEYYSASNPSGFLVADDITGKLDTSIYAANSANWNSTYNTVSANSADWSVAEEISGINGIKISESADKVIIEVSASYATEDWVTGQGYITGINYNTGSI